MVSSHGALALPGPLSSTDVRQHHQYCRALRRSRSTKQGPAVLLTPLRCCSSTSPLAQHTIGRIRCCFSGDGSNSRRDWYAGRPSNEEAARLAAVFYREGQEVVLRCRMERCRGRGKLAFLHLRQPPLESIQAVCEGKVLATIAKDISPESVVEVRGVLRRALAAITSVTCQHVEIVVTELHVVSRAATPLPFPLQDENTKLDTRLNHRVMDLRTTRSVATMRLVSAICQSFRHRLLDRAFVEIHTPKLIAVASEGGSEVFRVDYFGSTAFLAQSPQLYKQMMIMADAMRVFEVGPVFRAENSLTHRHLTEFIGLDGEMVICDDYREVLDVLESVLCGVLSDLVVHHHHLLSLASRSSLAAASTATTEQSLGSAAAANHPNDPLPVVHLNCEVLEDTIRSLGIAMELPCATISTAATDLYGARVSASAGAPHVLRLSFANAARLLNDCDGDDGQSEDKERENMGSMATPLVDFTLQQERRLGQLIRQRYGVDLYIIDQFPAEARPFYTMPLDVEHPDGATRSYDMYLRGEEICSGAQRIHDVLLLEQRLASKGIDRSSVNDYVAAFRYGAWPHGGFGLGLERIALFLLAARDIRQVSLFPRDPKRLTP